nr:histone-lysine N-methyltransferase PRDM9-like [Lytechinus pictus]
MSLTLPEAEMDQYLLDVQVYFTAMEWAKFSSYERICIKNVKENYEMMNKVGLQVTPPMFIQRQQEIKIEIKEENDSEDEKMMLEPFHVPVEDEKPDHIKENKLQEESPNHGRREISAHIDGFTHSWKNHHLVYPSPISYVLSCVASPYITREISSHVDGFTNS